MPQHRQKVKTIAPAVGTKYNNLQGDVFSSGGAKLGSSQLITKGQNNSWPGSDWTGTIKNADAIRSAEEKEKQRKRPVIERPRAKRPEF